MEDVDRVRRRKTGKPARGKQLNGLLNDGNVPIPTRWVDTDRNAYLRFPCGPLVVPNSKSRLVGRCDPEGIDGFRKDSPAAETEGHILLFSFASSNKLRLNMADISNASFQGEKLDRLLLLKTPRAGIPDTDYLDGEAMIMARVPIDGTQDAGRQFWL